ncbi:transposase [Streptomyces angustmyceticus]|uniref:transposase n=1 Tax=Streptomyces angustmyceticus TaxID=285578 RepID=UPI0036F283CF
MGRGDLTDEPWAMLEPLLPKGMKAGRPPVWPRRQLIDGLRFRVRCAGAGRARRVRAVGRIHDLFRRWQRDGTWHRALTRCQVPGRRQGCDHLASERRLHGVPHSSARPAGRQARDLPNSPGVRPSSPGSSAPCRSGPSSPGNPGHSGR